MNKLAIAGRELMKGNFGNAIASVTTKRIESELIQPSRWRNGNFFFGVNGADKAFVWGNFNSSLIAYQLCPIVSAVIHKKAQAMVNGRQMIMTGKGTSAKEATSAQAKAIQKLLDKPNPLQTGLEFRAQGSIYKQIYGYCAILRMCPVGFENDYSKWTLWNIPPWMLLCTPTQDFWWEKGYKPFINILLSYMGHTTYLPMDNVFFIKENQISTGTYLMNSTAPNVSLFLPDSRLYGLQTNIDNLITSLAARGSLSRNRGPQWLLTNDSGSSEDAGFFPNDPENIKALHADFLQYGIGYGQRKAIITDAKLKLQTVGFDVKQLQLLEGEIQDAKQICDGLNYPPYLLGLVDAKFDNQDIAERSFYTNSIIPDSISEDKQWSDLLGLDELGLRLETDFNHLPALQENIIEMGRGRWYMNQALEIEWLNDLLTWNEWRTVLGGDTVPGMDKYYSDLVKEGRIVPVPRAPSSGGNVQTDVDQQAQQSGNSNNQNSNSNGNGNQG